MNYNPIDDHIQMLINAVKRKDFSKRHTCTPKEFILRGLQLQEKRIQRYEIKVLKAKGYLSGECWGDLKRYEREWAADMVGV